MNSKIIIITAGKGPVECSLVVAQVLKILLQEIRLNGLAYNILKHKAGAINGSIDTLSLEIIGEALDDFLNKWLGTIQWIAQSPIRPKHRRKNWFIGVFAFENNKSLPFNSNKVIFQTMRSSGAGGQHVNKVSSAVRAIDPKTNIQVNVQESRSQHQNKKIALKRLEEKVKQQEQMASGNLISEQWLSSLKIERGNPIRTFRGGDYNPKQMVRLSNEN